MLPAKLLAAILPLFGPALVSGHGAMTWPPPRNGVDRDLSPWSGPAPNPTPSVESKTGWCPSPNHIDGKVGGQNGQACFWFSNGCAIGCDACDGTSRGPIPNSKDPFWKRKFNVCNQTDFKATICDKELRTVNRDAECGAADDWYYYSPWRAPGNAPVFDSCGKAGGHDPPQGTFGGIYVSTKNAKLGDLGSKVLPEYDVGVKWEQGSIVEVSWSIEANHGGGYLYRLCPADSELDEDCFRKYPLEFTGKQVLRWGGKNGTQIEIDGVYVSEGTVPAASTWALNPIPRNDYQQTGAGFEPPCKRFGMDPRKCQGMMDGQSAVPDLEIVDEVHVPEDVAPGRYVLGWRWDCEESNQIWASCADVTIVAKSG